MNLRRANFVRETRSATAKRRHLRWWPPARAGAFRLVVAAIFALCPTVWSAEVDRDLSAYGEIVTQYRAGDVTGAVQVVESWRRERLLQAAVRLWQLKEGARASRGWSTTAIAGACLLHLEVMDRHPDQPFRQALHMQILRKHLAMLRVDGAAPLAATLSLALALSLQGQLKIEDLRSLFDELGETDVSDGPLLLARGTMYELLASRRLEAARDARLVPGAKESLQEAERFLRRCLAVASRTIEARLRLAHVVIVQGRPEEGIALLEPPLPESNEAEARYLADLFLGQAYALAGRSESAAKAFSAAAAQSPCGQAAAVALAHLAFREQRFAAAREVLDPVLRRPAGCTDPWAVYDFGQAARLPGLIDELRRAVQP